MVHVVPGDKAGAFPHRGKKTVRLVFVLLIEPVLPALLVRRKSLRHRGGPGWGGALTLAGCKLPLHPHAHVESVRSRAHIHSEGIPP